MSRAALTVAEVFRRYGDTFRTDVGAALSTAQRRVMTAIEQCHTAALGGHVEQCDHCGHRRVWYNSCRNRHCPTCQSLARAAWLERRRADLLPTEYFHVVLTVPPAVAEIAAQNLDYLGRYTHRIAISNQRLCSLHDGSVSFRYTDYRSNGASRRKIMTLTATEFIRRMLLHVLPPGFHRIRYYGFLANRNRQQKLTECRRSLRTPPPAKQDGPVATDYRDRYEALTGRSLRRCPQCDDGNMQAVDHLDDAWGCPAILDSS